MAFPLKSGADLYNQQLIRAAIWNYGADLSETVTGLIYFNTSNSSAGKKLRLYTGSAWKTLAFEEDLDVANNAEFKALEDKVKLLAGEVDTDAIISNMKEVSNFLAGFAEDANLMSVLDGKLDKSGGTITGGLTLSSPNSDYALHFQTGLGAGWIGFQADSERWFVTDRNWSAGYTLIHSGNIASQHVSKADAAGGFMITNLNLNANTITAPLAWFYGQSDAGKENWPDGHQYGCILTLSVGDANLSGQLAWDIAHNSDTPTKKLWWRARNDRGWGNDWKTIAFTDSNVASAQALVHSNGKVGATIRDNGIVSFNEFIVLKNNKFHMGTLNDGTTERNILGINSNNNLLVGYGSRWDGKTLIYGDGIEYIIKDTPAMLINSSGNVGIGLTEPKHKLHVAGDIATNKYLRVLAWEGYGSGSCDMWFDGATSNLKMRSRLHVAYDIQADGNIVANGTIACKGIAAEGDAMDMVDKTVLHIPSSTTQQTFTLNHGLGTREITISIYEITSMGTNMILTDVEIVDDNNISVSFGNPPTENHMVVVMG